MGNTHTSVYWGVSSFCCGTAAAYTLDPNGLVYAGLCGVALGLLLRIRRYVDTGLLALVLISALVGWLWADYRMARDNYHPLDDYLGQEMVFEGVVVDESDVRDYNTRVVVELDGYDVRVLVRVPHAPHYNYGDRLRLSGTLVLPEGFVGDTGRYFDYRNFLLVDRIRYIMVYPDTELVATGQGTWLKTRLFTAKAAMIDRLQQLYGEPQVSLLGGLLVGAKSAMGQDLLDDFRDTGVIHIVVLSGFNITIIIWFFMLILTPLGERPAALVGFVGIVCFTLLTGAGATVVRASLMASFAILARITGNYAATLRMLCIAGLCMLVYQPMLLLYSPSFQLSFLATLGLILLVPHVTPWLSWMPNHPAAPLRELLSATIATQIMVTPLLLWMMGTFPTYSLFANFLILATVPYVMATGFASLVLSLVSPLLAWPVVGVTHYILSYELAVVDFFAHLPAAAFTIPPFPFEWVVLVYLLYTVAGYCLRHTSPMSV